MTQYRYFARVATALAVTLVAAGCSTATSPSTSSEHIANHSTNKVYTDRLDNFSFSYPAEWGEPLIGLGNVNNNTVVPDPATSQGPLRAGDDRVLPAWSMSIGFSTSSVLVHVLRSSDGAIDLRADRTDVMATGHLITSGPRLAVYALPLVFNDSSIDPTDAVSEPVYLYILYVAFVGNVRVELQNQIAIPGKDLTAVGCQATQFNSRDDCSRAWFNSDPASSEIRNIVDDDTRVADSIVITSSVAVPTY
jgi:hypothetical protein